MATRSPTTKRSSASVASSSHRHGTKSGSRRTHGRSCRRRASTPGAVSTCTTRSTAQPRSREFAASAPISGRNERAACRRRAHDPHRARGEPTGAARALPVRCPGELLRERPVALGVCNPAPGGGERVRASRRDEQVSIELLDELAPRLGDMQRRSDGVPAYGRDDEPFAPLRGASRVPPRRGLRHEPVVTLRRKQSRFQVYERCGARTRVEPGLH